MPDLKVAPLPPPSGQKKVKATVWLDPVLHKALLHECIDRDMTVGELVEEAVRSRTFLIRK